METMHRTVAAALFAGGTAAGGPPLAQTDSARIDELEIRTAEMESELVALRAELEAAREAGSSAQIGALREDVRQVQAAAERRMVTRPESPT